ncbi:hypothetical protein Tco_0563498 [Tanacetum coccineum]
MASSITRFDIEKFDGKNDFGLWKIKMRDLMVQQGYDAALEQFPADMEAREKARLIKKAYNMKLDDHIDEFNKLILDLANIDIEIEDEDHALMLLTESLIMEDVLATLNSRELKKRTEGIKEETGNGLYVRGIFVKKGKRDQDSDSFDDEGNVYFGEALVVVGNDEMTELVMNSSGSYHMTHRRDFLYDYKVVDDGLIRLDVRLRRSLISLGTLEKEGYTIKMQVDKRVWFKLELLGAQVNREAEVFQVSNDDVAMAQRRLEDKQLKEKTNTDCLVKEQEKVHLGIKVGANITVTGVLGQGGAEGNVDE